MDVNLNMLHATMMDMVGCHVDNTDVVMVDDHCRSNRDVEPLKKLSQPTTFGNSMSQGLYSASALE